MFNHSLTSAYFVCSSCSVCFACFVLNVAFTSVAYAGRDKEFKEYLSQTKVLKKDIGKSTAGFAPEKIFDGYNSNPNPAKYYSEDNAGDVQVIKSDSIAKAALDKEGQAVAESSKIRPQFKISNESEEISKGKSIQNLASKNIKGILEEFISGKEDQVSTKVTKYVTKTCNEEIRALKRICTKSPVVKIISQPYQEMRQYSGAISRTTNNSGNVITIPVSGVITSFSSYLHSYPSDSWWCNTGYGGYLQGAYVSTCTVGCGRYLGHLSFQNGSLNISVNANSLVSFSFSGPARGGWHTSGYSLAIKANLTKKVPEISWQEVCQDV